MIQIPEPGHDPDDAREAAQRILDNADFDPESNPVTWLAGQRGLGAVFVVLVILALFALVLWFVRRGVRSETGSQASGPVVVLGEDVDPAQAESELQSAVTRRDYSGEVVARYRVIVVDLVQRGILGEEVSRTTGEYVSQLRARRPQDGPVFSAATTIFEDVYYGDIEVGSAEADVVARAQRELRKPQSVLADQDGSDAGLEALGGRDS